MPRKPDGCTFLLALGAGPQGAGAGKSGAAIGVPHPVSRDGAVVFSSNSIGPVAGSSETLTEKEDDSHMDFEAKPSPGGQGTVIY